MLILTIRTDKPEAELGLYEDEKQLAYKTWQAHRELSKTIHQQLNEVLTSQSQELSHLNGIVYFKGPGSFTGLRIGGSVANALAYSLAIPIIATMGSGWISQGIARLQAGESDTVALPEYGGSAHITEQRK